MSKKKKSRRPGGGRAPRLGPHGAALRVGAQPIWPDAPTGAADDFYGLQAQTPRSTIFTLLDRKGARFVRAVVEDYERLDDRLSLRDRIRRSEQFTQRFPTVPDAAAAAAAGAEVTIFGTGDLTSRLRILHTPTGPVAEESVYTELDVQQLAITAVMNAEDPVRAAQRVTAALDALVRSRGIPSLVTAISEPSSSSVPRFGWRARFDASTWTTWDEMEAHWDASVMSHLVRLVSKGEDLSLGAREHAAVFREHGLRIVLCKACDAALTDRHPLWPGVWISPAEGPVCTPDDDRPDPTDVEEYDCSVTAGPHQPDQIQSLA